jgi:hypothetical protein
MAFKHDPRVDLARARTMREVVDFLPLQDLQNVSGELTGPCPKCAGDDRFSINVKKGVYNCRSCGAGDALQLVRLFYDCDFMEAVEYLEGKKELDIDPAELARRQEAKRRADEKSARDAAQYRQWAKGKAIEIWQRGAPFAGTMSAAYLAHRGCNLSHHPHIFKCFRHLEAHPYIKKIAGENVTLHTGPALISAVQDARGRLSAVHQTWLDLSTSSGKAEIRNPGLRKPPAAKLVQGSKKGGAIRLSGNACLSTLVMGEGIETTLSALVVAPAALSGAVSYWAGVDLGNMAGVMQRVPGTRYSGLPDLSDAEAWIPPANVTRLIFIMDGDSEPKMTRAKLLSGLRRAMDARPGLSAQIVRAGDGVDLNDILKDPK